MKTKQKVRCQKVAFATVFGLFVTSCFLGAINNRKDFLVNKQSGSFLENYRPSFLMAAADAPAATAAPAASEPVYAAPAPASEEKKNKDIEPQKTSAETVSAPQQSSVEKIEEDDEGPETVQLSEEQIGLRGNWVKKREWLVRAEAQNKKIQNLVKEIEVKRAPIWESFKKVQDDFDDFYKFASRAQGKLEVVFGVSKELDEKKTMAELKQQVLLDLKQTTTKEEVVPWYNKVINKFSSVWAWVKSFFISAPQENVVKKSDVQEKLLSVENIDVKATSTSPGEEKIKKPTELDFLKNNLTDVKKFDDALVKRFEKLNEELALIVNEIDRAKTLQSEMWDIIDDAKARSNFYEIKVITKKVKSIKEYIEGDFVSDFESTVEAARAKMKKVEEKVKELEEAGMITKDESLPSKLKNELNPTESTTVNKAERNVAVVKNETNKSFWQRFSGWFSA